jgi:3-mercaptopyruvate sulfurtransferase SseA
MKKTQQTTQSSANMTLVVLVAGGLLVAGLVGWALTRNLNAPASTPAATETAAATGTVPGAPQPSVQDRASVARITPDELKQKLDRGEVTIVDVRDGNSFVAGHIPGSLNIPFSRIEGEIPYLPKAKPIVLYCT